MLPYYRAPELHVIRIGSFKIKIRNKIISIHTVLYCHKVLSGIVFVDLGGKKNRNLIFTFEGL